MDDIKKLDTTDFNEAPSVTVVSSDNDVDIEMIAVDINGNVDPISLEYNDYRDDLNKMYEASTDENSFISSFVVQDDKCIHTMMVKFMDGSSEKKVGREFDYNKSFQEDFLVPVVEDFNRHNGTFDSSIEVIDNDHANFIVRSQDNDCLCISNIDISFANRLRDLLPKQEIAASSPKQLVKINEKGIGNYLVIILTIVAIGMTLAGTIFFTISS